MNVQIDGPIKTKGGNIYPVTIIGLFDERDEVAQIRLSRNGPGYDYGLYILERNFTYMLGAEDLKLISDFITKMNHNE